MQDSFVGGPFAGLAPDYAMEMEAGSTPRDWSVPIDISRYPIEVNFYDD